MLTIDGKLSELSRANIWLIKGSGIEIRTIYVPIPFAIIAVFTCFWYNLILASIYIQNRNILQ